MEVFGIWQTSSHLGTEKFQMSDLNKRLEMYLSRVQLLEEENELLQKEAESLRRRRSCQAWRGELEAKLREAREEAEVAWKEKDRVELEVGNLCEALHTLELQRQREVAARAETRKRHDESKKELEEEHRIQILLQEKLVQLKKELQLQAEVHNEDIAFLQTRLLQVQHVPAPVVTQVLDLQDLSQEYCHRATQAWQQAAEAYQSRMQHLENSLTQARSHMGQVIQEKKESYLKAQALAKELEAARGNKEALEKHISQLKDKQFKELQHLQVHLESLEREKAEMSNQTTVILEDKQNMLQMKMSLGLEVAAYRALLDSESLRTHMPSINHYTSSCTFDEVLNTRSLRQNSITPTTTKLLTKAEMKPSKMILTTLQAQATPKQQKFLSAGLTKKEHIDWCMETSKALSRSAPYTKRLENWKGSAEHFRTKVVNKKVIPEDAASVQKPQELEGVKAHSTNQSIMGDIHMEGMGEEYVLHLAEKEKCLDLMMKDPIMEQEIVSDLKNQVSSEVPPETEQPSRSRSTLEIPDTMMADKQLTKEFRDKDVEEFSEITAENGFQQASGKKQTLAEKQVSHIKCTIMTSEYEPEKGKNMDVTAEDDHSNSTDFNNDEQITGESDFPLLEVKDQLSQVVVSRTKSEKLFEEDSEPEEDLINELNEMSFKLKRQSAEDAGSIESFKMKEEIEVSESREQMMDEMSHPEQADFSDDDEKELSHASYSWKTGDPESNDSYALDNTLADTRPLIRYKSDEADMNTQASYLGDSDTSENCDEREPGAGFGVEEKRFSFTSKGINVMKELNEETEGKAIQMDRKEPLKEGEINAGHALESGGAIHDTVNEKNFAGDTGHLEFEEEEICENKVLPLSEEKMDEGQIEERSSAINETDGNDRKMGGHTDYLESEEEEIHEEKKMLLTEERDEDRVEESSGPINDTYGTERNREGNTDHLEPEDKEIHEENKEESLNEEKIDEGQVEESGDPINETEGTERNIVGNVAHLGLEEEEIQVENKQKQLNNEKMEEAIEESEGPINETDGTERNIEENMALLESEGVEIYEENKETLLNEEKVKEEQVEGSDGSINESDETETNIEENMDHLESEEENIHEENKEELLFKEKMDEGNAEESGGPINETDRRERHIEGNMGLLVSEGDEIHEENIETLLNEEKVKEEQVEGSDGTINESDKTETNIEENMDHLESEEENIHEENKEELLFKEKMDEGNAEESGGPINETDRRERHIEGNMGLLVSEGDEIHEENIETLLNEEKVKEEQVEGSDGTINESDETETNIEENMDHLESEEENIHEENKEELLFKEKVDEGNTEESGSPINETDRGDRNIDGHMGLLVSEGDEIYEQNKETVLNEEKVKEEQVEGSDGTINESDETETNIEENMDHLESEEENIHEENKEELLFKEKMDEGNAEESGGPINETDRRERHIEGNMGLLVSEGDEIHEENKETLLNEEKVKEEQVEGSDGSINESDETETNIEENMDHLESEEENIHEENKEELLFKEKMDEGNAEESGGPINETDRRERHIEGNMGLLVSEGDEIHEENKETVLNEEKVKEEQVEGSDGTISESDETKTNIEENMDHLESEEEHIHEENKEELLFKEKMDEGNAEESGGPINETDRGDRNIEGNMGLLVSEEEEIYEGNKEEPFDEEMMDEEQVEESGDPISSTDENERNLEEDTNILESVEEEIHEENKEEPLIEKKMVEGQGGEYCAVIRDKTDGTTINSEQEMCILESEEKEIHDNREKPLNDVMNEGQVEQTAGPLSDEIDGNMTNLEGDICNLESACDLIQDHNRKLLNEEKIDKVKVEESGCPINEADGNYVNWEGDMGPFECEGEAIQNEIKKEPLNKKKTDVSQAEKKSNAVNDGLGGNEKNQEDMGYLKSEGAASQQKDIQEPLNEMIMDAGYSEGNSAPTFYEINGNKINLKEDKTHQEYERKALQGEEDHKELLNKEEMGAHEAEESRGVKSEEMDENERNLDESTGKTNLDTKQDMERRKEFETITHINVDTDLFPLSNICGFSKEEVVLLEDTKSGEETDEVSPVNTDSPESPSHLENFATSLPSSPPMGEFAESNEQPLINESVQEIKEISLAQTMTLSEECSGKMLLNIEKMSTKKEEDGQNLSMLTNVDFTEDLSGHSELISNLESQDITANSDLDDSYISDNDSPNNSQFLQLMNQVSAHHKEKEAALNFNISGLTEETQAHSLEAFSNNLENSRSISGLFHQQPCGVEEGENEELQEPVEFEQTLKNRTGFCESFLCSKEKSEEHTASEQWENAKESTKDYTNTIVKENDIFTVKEPDALLPSNGKCADLHSFFSENLNEDVWNSTKWTGASYVPKERESSDHVNTETNFTFGVTWEDTEKEFAKEAVKQIKVHSLEEQESTSVHVKKHLSKNTEEDEGHSGDSLEERDSWSSGKD